MDKVRSVDEFFTKVEKEGCDQYDRDLASILKRCEGKTISGTRWDSATIKEVHHIATEYNVYQHAADDLELERNKLNDKINAKMKEYEAAPDEKTAKKHLAAINSMLAQLKQVKLDFAHYEGRRKELLGRAIEYSEKIEAAKLHLGLKTEQKHSNSKTNNKR